MRSLIFCSLMFIHCVCAQEKIPTAKFLFQKSAETYAKNNQYAFVSQYQMYKNYTSTTVTESYDGEIVKFNNQTYFRIKDFEFVNFQDLSIQVSQSEKAILVYKQANKTNLLSPINLEKYINGYVIKVTSTNNFWICDLTPSKGSQVMAHKIMVYLNKSDFTIAKQEIYMLSQLQYGNTVSKKAIEAPKMVVTFRKRAINSIKDQAHTAKTSYITGVGKKLYVSKRYAGYKLIQG